MNIITNNPYRLLGVCANSPIKERVANHTKMKAFLKVGKQISFPLDLLMYMPPVERTPENVAQAEVMLTLPVEQVKYAQFWFLNVTPMDDLAFKCLFKGSVKEAKKIWAKKDNASSLQNRIICALIMKDYGTACELAQTLYNTYTTDFLSIIDCESIGKTSDNLAFTFLDVLLEMVDVKSILSYISNKKWHQYIGEKSLSPIINRLQSAVNTAIVTRGQGGIKRYVAGEKLMKEANILLPQLQQYLSFTDLRYQMIADKVGQEILQCGIDYFNASDEPDAAIKAMLLQKYAQSVVVGNMAKSRCKENTDILRNIIDNLPPQEVYAEDKVIKEELRKFCQLPDRICYAVALLNNTKPHLQAIKRKLGVKNTYYLKVSTQVVGNALHNVIEEVNDIQNSASTNQYIRMCGSFEDSLEAAWKAMLIMDKFDMESEFKVHYNHNRDTLYKMREHILKIKSIFDYSSRVHSHESHISTQSTFLQSSTDSSDNLGCTIVVLSGLALLFVFLVLVLFCGLLTM